MRDVRRWLAVPALVLALVVAGCSSGSGGGDSDPIVMGASLPLTGEFQQPGEAAQRGYQIWQEMTNAQGGLLDRQVELKFVDDGSSQDTIVNNYNRLITQDKVDLLLGSFSSLLNIPASAVAERNKMLYVCPACGSPQMFSRGFKYIFFAQPAVSAHQADQFAQYVASIPANQRPKTAAYPYVDDPFAEPIINSLETQLKAIGIQTVYKEKLPSDQINFETVAAKVKASKAELVAAGEAGLEDGVSFVRALIKADVRPKALLGTSAPTNGKQYLDALGQGNVEGVFFAASWSSEANFPLNKEFVQAYRAKFGQVPEEDAADAFAAAQVVQAAVEATKSLDQTKLADWIHNNRVQTILGPLSWDQRGAPQGSFILSQWQGGETKVVLPRSVATTDKIVFPKPAWQPGQGQG